MVLKRNNKKKQMIANIFLDKVAKNQHGGASAIKFGDMDTTPYSNPPSLKNILPIIDGEIIDGPINVDKKREINLENSLRGEFPYNDNLIERIQNMSDKYENFLPIRGDGNCYYRAVAVGYLQKALCSKDEEQKEMKKHVKNLTEIITFQNAIVKAKMLIVRKLNSVKSIGTFIKTDNGFKVSNPEGYVAIDRVSGNAVKLVDRMEFSFNNFTAIKAWDKS